MVITSFDNANIEYTHRISKSFLENLLKMENCTLKNRLIAFIQNTGLSKSEFERKVGLANGYINNLKGSIGSDKLEKILSAFPELNIEWLLRGSGDMTSVTQSIGDVHNSSVSGVNVSGNGIHIDSDNYLTLLKIVETNQRSTEKFQEQIDKLIHIIENKYGTENR